MGRLRDVSTRLRWMGVPLAAYLLIALVLPAFHGAAARRDFLHHAIWVLAGCAAVIAGAALFAAAADLAGACARRLRAGNRSTEAVVGPRGGAA